MQLMRLADTECWMVGAALAAPTPRPETTLAEPPEKQRTCSTGSTLGSACSPCEHVKTMRGHSSVQLQDVRSYRASCRDAHPGPPCIC